MIVGKSSMAISSAFVWRFVWWALSGLATRNGFGERAGVAAYGKAPGSPPGRACRRSAHTGTYRLKAPSLLLSMLASYGRPGWLLPCSGAAANGPLSHPPAPYCYSKRDGDRSSRKAPAKGITQNLGSVEHSGYPIGKRPKKWEKHDSSSKAKTARRARKQRRRLLPTITIVHVTAGCGERATGTRATANRHIRGGRQTGSNEMAPMGGNCLARDQGRAMSRLRQV
ncbi:hypothetical protein GQ53DRAFT_1391 [Thozetella sp. PMI_491]|nr:hypothetical protein GQ53DRAFT_1391 [Thozetella sp. PMI_491]